MTIEQLWDKHTENIQIGKYREIKNRGLSDSQPSRRAPKSKNERTVSYI